jgi:pyridoxal phosphate enzyme (YggS family)
MTAIADHLTHLRTNIHHQHTLLINPQTQISAPTLIAVSKTFSADAVWEAVQADQRDFAENYVQEGVDKIIALRERMHQHMNEGMTQNTTTAHTLMWHFIGPLQSNKTALVAEYFDWVHSVDRLKIAQRLSTQRPAHLPPLQICLQINISHEASKTGLTPAQLPDIEALAGTIATLPNLHLRGLMVIPAATDDVAQQRAAFADTRRLLDHLNQVCQLKMDVLSMGMSDDWQAAVAEGATHIRIGRAIFGTRGAF